MDGRLLAGGVIALALALPATAQEAEEGDPAAGLELAQTLCTGCHIVGTERSGSDAAPPFQAIATDPAMTLEELHAWLEPAHPMLPDLALGQKQIADINAYLDSLRPGAATPEQDPGLPEGASPRIETEEPPPAIEQAPPEEIGPPIVPEAEEGG